MYRALTNDHPGNEWFRRLVRSNRQYYIGAVQNTSNFWLPKPLYKSSRKSKESTGKIFGEDKNREDGTVSNIWTPMNYKNVVETVSQA
mmetsp:Transcript_25559/g.29286  ORF Transcript_25559/g.29286 Transcript_25559/m.29286 type:complete len:88 (+) Transcript_25559:173-436(+)